MPVAMNGDVDALEILMEGREMERHAAFVLMVYESAIVSRLYVVQSETVDDGVMLARSQARDEFPGCNIITTLFISQSDIATIELDTKAIHTVRLAIDRAHKASVYVDNQLAATATLVEPTVGERITWGHLDEPTPSTARSRWQAVHYTLEGAFSHRQRTFR